MTRDRHGVKFLRKIAQKGGRVTATRYRDLLSEFGKLGGRPRRPALNEPVGEGAHDEKEAICGRPSGLPPPPVL